jgi:hypothetical protein
MRQSSLGQKRSRRHGRPTSPPSFSFPCPTGRSSFHTRAEREEVGGTGRDDTHVVAFFDTPSSEIAARVTPGMRAQVHDKRGGRDGDGQRTRGHCLRRQKVWPGASRALDSSLTDAPATILDLITIDGVHIPTTVINAVGALISFLRRKRKKPHRPLPFKGNKLFSPQLRQLICKTSTDQDRIRIASALVALNRRCRQVDE